MSDPVARPTLPGSLPAGCRRATRRHSPRPRCRRPPGCGRHSSRSPTQRRARSMDKVALLPNRRSGGTLRRDRRWPGRRQPIIEKDFWVCWTLKRLFELQQDGCPTLVFKGGTSLSKAYGAIRRFSEDIDLSFDRADLGYTGDAGSREGGDQQKACASAHR